MSGDGGVAPDDRLELRSIRVVAAHGALEHERAIAQPFEVDLDVGLDLADAGRSDELASSVDYGSLVDEVVAIVGGPHRRLLESLAEAIADATLAHDRVRWVTVVVRKLRPPVPAELATAGVRITRRRGARGGSSGE